MKQLFISCSTLHKLQKISAAAAAAAKSLQSWPTLCDPIDGSPLGSPVPGILQAGKNTGVGCHFLLQCIKVKMKVLSRVMTPWTAAHQAPPSMGFSRQKYWSGLPLPSPEGIRGNIKKWHCINLHLKL